ncbi:hypothetical protein [Actinomadura rugatobispora]|uniref:Crocagin biosynthetic protein CgnE/B domain-containing protein n=1 Tax=Actinomadura rugatobispora TaxID=1994 RepID=A0ABW1A9K4_9ACTN|nr:hypothetical protein GCM10010200_022190 [Actinomadura rugatobispora]
MKDHPASGGGHGDSAAVSTGKLRDVFPDGEIHAVSDDEALLRAASRYGLSSIPLAEAGELPAGANVVLFLRHVLLSKELRKRFREAKVLLVPIASFDTGLDAALYTLRLTLLTDYGAACERSRRWIDDLRSRPDPITFVSTGPCPAGEPGTHLVCSLSDDLSIDAWASPAIATGQWVGVGSYCEIALTARPRPDRPRPFTIDGTAVASGVLAARDPRFDEAGDARIRAAHDLRRELNRRAPIVLRLRGGVLADVRAGGDDFTDALREVTDPAYGLHALELGLGTNQHVLPHVDWTFNSQLNEGAGPVHIGFGDGITGAHMDFVVAAATHHFGPSL